jgi:hypothetical protein
VILCWWCAVTSVFVAGAVALSYVVLFVFAWSFMGFSVSFSFKGKVRMQAPKATGLRQVRV